MRGCKRGETGRASCYLGELSISSVKDIPLRAFSTSSLSTFASIMSLPCVTAECRSGV